MMEGYMYGAGAGALLLLLGLKKIAGKKALVKKYSLLIDFLLIAGCMLLLGIYFYRTGLKAGMIAVVMGAIALGKYLYDKSQDGHSEN
jgi:hypothetical protein